MAGGGSTVYCYKFNNLCKDLFFLPLSLCLIVIVKIDMIIFSPICPWKFCRKTRFESSQTVFCSLLCFKMLKLTLKPFTGHTLRGLLIQMQNISLQSSACAEKLCQFRVSVQVRLKVT